MIRCFRWRRHSCPLYLSKTLRQGQRPHQSISRRGLNFTYDPYESLPHGRPCRSASSVATKPRQEANNEGRKEHFADKKIGRGRGSKVPAVSSSSRTSVQSGNTESAVVARPSQSPKDIVASYWWDRTEERLKRWHHLTADEQETRLKGQLSRIKDKVGTPYSFPETEGIPFILPPWLEKGQEQVEGGEETGMEKVENYATGVDVDSALVESSQRSFLEKIKSRPVAPWYAHLAAPPLLLTLDAFGTLYTPKEPVAMQYAEVARQYGYDLSDKAIGERLKDAMHSVQEDYPRYGVFKGMALKDWWDKVIERTFLPLISSTGKEPPEESDVKATEQFKKLQDALYVRFSTSEGYALYPDAMELLDHIAKKSYQPYYWAPKRTMLGIVSNSDPRLRSVLASFDPPILVGGVSLDNPDMKLFRNLSEAFKHYKARNAFNTPIDHPRVASPPSLWPPRFAPFHRADRPDLSMPAHFSFATLSYDVPAKKPAAITWQYAEAAAQEALESMADLARLTRSGRTLLKSVEQQFVHVHVGDELDTDVLGAMSAGWDAILLDRKAEERISTRQVVDHDGNPQSVTVIRDLMALPEILTRDRLEALRRQRQTKMTETEQLEAKVSLQGMPRLNRNRKKWREDRARIARDLHEESVREEEPAGEVEKRPDPRNATWWYVEEQKKRTGWASKSLRVDLAALGKNKPLKPPRAPEKQEGWRQWWERLEEETSRAESGAMALEPDELDDVLTSEVDSLFGESDDEGVNDMDDEEEERDEKDDMDDAEEERHKESERRGVSRADQRQSIHGSVEVDAQDGPGARVPR